MAPEVSALDYTNEVNISGFDVPGITTRRVNTEVELADGESFMIGGLLDKSIRRHLREDSFYWRHSDPRQVIPIRSQDQERYGADRDCDAGDRFAASRQMRRCQTLNYPVRVPAAEFKYPDASAGCEDAGEHDAARSGIVAGGDAG